MIINLCPAGVSGCVDYFILPSGFLFKAPKQVLQIERAWDEFPLLG